MLIKLLKERLKPYKNLLAAVVVFQFIGVVAMLYLPSLNADIIDKGVAVGDTSYIVRTGAMMLGVTLIQVVSLGQRRLVRCAYVDEPRPRPARGPVPPGRHLLDPRGPGVRCSLADHPRHQRRARRCRCSC